MEERRVTRNSAINVIKESKGKIITVLFTRKDGLVREIKGIYDDTDEKGYLRMISFEDEGYRNVNPETLKFVIANNIKHRVRK